MVDRVNPNPLLVKHCVETDNLYLKIFLSNYFENVSIIFVILKVKTSKPVAPIFFHQDNENLNHLMLPEMMMFLVFNGKNV